MRTKFLTGKKRESIGHFHENVETTRLVCAPITNAHSSEELSINWQTNVERRCGRTLEIVKLIIFDGKPFSELFKPIVLCGGEGSRLRPLTYYFQKAMIPVGREQRPLLEYILRHIRFHNFSEAVLLVGYKGEQVVNYFEDGRRVGLKLTYVWDTEEVKGTCASIRNALNQGAFSEEDTLLIYYGDILTNLNLTELVEKHRLEKAAATLAVSPKYQLPVGVAEVKNGRVEALREKPYIPINVTVGILTLEARHIKKAPEAADIMADLIPHLIQQGEKVAAYISDAFWYDVGSTERYEKLTSEIVDRHLSGILKRTRSV